MQTLASIEGETEVATLAAIVDADAATCAQHLNILAEVGIAQLQRNATVVSFDTRCRTRHSEATDLLLGTVAPKSRTQTRSGVRIRGLHVDDWPAVLRIYSEGIATGNATFETGVPDRETPESKWLPDHRCPIR